MYKEYGANVWGIVLIGKRIAIVDDHQLFLDGARNLFASQSSETIVFTFNDPLRILAELKEGVDFDVIVADFLMGTMNGLAFVGALRSRNIATPVLLLSGFEDRLPAGDLLTAGANGFVSKKSDVKLFFSAVRTVMDGGAFFDGEALSADELQAMRLSANTVSAEEPNPAKPPKLSGRQIEILHQIRLGLSNREISQHLSISENTVKSHLKQIFLELKVSKRTASVQKAQIYGLL